METSNKKNVKTLVLTYAMLLEMSEQMKKHADELAAKIFETDAENAKYLEGTDIISPELVVSGGQYYRPLGVADGRLWCVNVSEKTLETPFYNVQPELVYFEQVVLPTND